MTHPSSLLDETIHQRVRFGIMAVLVEADNAEFTFLRTELGLTDGNLTRHLQVLEEAGMVSRRKRKTGGRQTTWFSATKTGRTAFEVHIRALQQLIDKSKGDS